MHSLNFLWGFTAFDMKSLIAVAYIKYKHTCLGLFLENKLYWRKNTAWQNQSWFSKLKTNYNSTSIWNLPGLKPIWHFLDSGLNIQNLATVFHLLRFFKLVWFITNSGYYVETVVSDELWLCFSVWGTD